MKKKNNTIALIIVIIAILLISVILIRMFDTKKVYVYNFKHVSTTDLVYGDESYKEKGNYYAAIIMPKRDEITIEENVFKDKYDDTTRLVESIIYSKDKIKKSYAEEYLYKVHDNHRCGVILKRYRKVIKDYYYLKYEIPGEC